MSLRKQARILGIAPSYLSMLVNGKRKWPDDLRYRYQELVNSVVNNEGKAAYEITGAQEGIRTPTPLREADFKSAASTIPPPGLALLQRGRLLVRRRCSCWARVGGSRSSLHGLRDGASVAGSLSEYIASGIATPADVWCSVGDFLDAWPSDPLNVWRFHALKTEHQEYLASVVDFVF